MTKLKEKFNLNKNERPLVIEPDIIHLFLALGETSCNAVAMAIIVQRIAHITAKTKNLDIMTQELLDIFPFMCGRSLKRNIHKLREYGIWKNRKYKPNSKMASYENIRISFKAVARLAKKVQEKQSQKELKAMCRKMNKEKEA